MPFRRDSLSNSSCQDAGGIGPATCRFSCVFLRFSSLSVCARRVDDRKSSPALAEEELGTTDCIGVVDDGEEADSVAPPASTCCLLCKFRCRRKSSTRARASLSFTLVHDEEATSTVIGVSCRCTADLACKFLWDDAFLPKWRKIRAAMHTRMRKITVVLNNTK